MDPFVFQQMNQRPQCPLIGAERIDRVESVESQAAQRAPPGLIQRMLVEKRRTASDAVELGVKRLRLLQAAAANWNSGKLKEGIATEGLTAKRFTAYATLVGEYQIDEAANYPFNDVINAIGNSVRTWQKPTREDSPPPNVFILTPANLL